MHGRSKQRCFEEGKAGAHTQSAARMKSYGPPAASTCVPLQLSDTAFAARRLPWLWAAIGCLGLPAGLPAARPRAQPIIDAASLAGHTECSVPAVHWCADRWCDPRSGSMQPNFIHACERMLARAESTCAALSVRGSRRGQGCTCCGCSQSSSRTCTPHPPYLSPPPSTRGIHAHGQLHTCSTAGTAGSHQSLLWPTQCQA